jgi:hypothetical protein
MSSIYYSLTYLCSPEEVGSPAPSLQDFPYSDKVQFQLLLKFKIYFSSHLLIDNCLILANKNYQLTIPPPVINWLINFLNNRMQRLLAS